MPQQTWEYHCWICERRAPRAPTWVTVFVLGSETLIGFLVCGEPCRTLANILLDGYARLAGWQPGHGDSEGAA